ncbi:uncharacterized protein LOC111633259 [Centruroides sculpturatus]|uniref:uncharacterized protein LOC111633259 n=1 Tax=Centruroides sculpturatus TaxID=218467 RepID=UPI000C6E06E0|nr:uncharacterized protein LOC111633259 [Centruroides sculpturatus]
MGPKAPFLSAQRMAKSAKTTVEKITEIVPVTQSSSILITELPEIIMFYVFQYLDDRNLDICSQVCSQWRDIIEHMMNHRVTMISRKIPLNVINSVIYESEKLHRYAEFGDNFQYNCFVFGDESVRNFHSQYKYVYLGHLYVGIAYPINEDEIRSFTERCKFSSIEETTEIQISMFPNIPDFNIFNYPFKLVGNESMLSDKSCLKNEIKKVCHKMNITDEEIKCFILYKDFAVCPYEDKTKPFINYSIHRDVYRLTVFYGKRANAFGVFILPDETCYKTAKRKLEKLKHSELKMVQKRCFAYIFHDSCMKCLDTATRAFREVFPLVNYVTYKFFPYYVSIIARKDEYFCVETNTPTHCRFSIIVFVWW